MIYKGLNFSFVPRTRFELARPCEHQPLKLACLPISTPGLNGTAKVIKFCNRKNELLIFTFKSDFIRLIIS